MLTKCYQSFQQYQLDLLIIYLQVLNVFQIKPDLDLSLMKPNQNLAVLTSGVLQGVHELLEKENFDWVIVQGDTTSSMAAAMAAFYQNVSIAHVEAGLRTWNKLSPFPVQEHSTSTTRCNRPAARPTDRWKNLFVPIAHLHTPAGLNKNRHPA